METKTTEIQPEDSDLIAVHNEIGKQIVGFVSEAKKAAIASGKYIEYGKINVKVDRTNGSWNYSVSFTLDGERDDS